MVSAQNCRAATAATANSANASARSSPVAGTPSQTSSRPKPKVNTNGYHPANPPTPLSAMVSSGLDLTSVERRGQPTAVREPLKKKTRPHGISEAPTYCPTDDEWRDPLEYIKKIAQEASQYGICKIIPPDSWNPDFAIDTEVCLSNHASVPLRPKGDESISSWQRQLFVPMLNLTDATPAEISLSDSKTGTQFGGRKCVTLSSAFNLPRDIFEANHSPQALGLT